jgi:hypothetical protein
MRRLVSCARAAAILDHLTGCELHDRSALLGYRSMTKRVVFLHPDGIAQIVGVLLNPDKVPQTTLESFMLRGRSIPFCVAGEGDGASGLLQRADDSGLLLFRRGAT